MSDLSGQEIKGYLLRELIGIGGFAAVYRAFQPAVEREVAVKIILPRHANTPEFIRRFESEAQLIARLEHMNIVPLYDFWREPNNAYLVMRWLRGGNLHYSIQRHGPWPVHAIARLLDQIASALAVAHRRGIIHRDLTPANILLDEENNAYLADFGIAKDTVRNNGGSDEQLYGSPAYIAPERIRHEPTTPQTDIYSLGIILYELLTGKLPFDAPTHTTLMSKHLHDPIPPLQVYSPDLPEEMNAIILQATAKNPKVRYMDALGMAADFRRTLGSVEHGAPAPHGQSPRGEELTGDGFHTIQLEQDTLILHQALEPENPYKGLRAFDEADAGDFFGREALVERLVRRMAEPGPMARFLAVVGPSGSGKSSVVKAGLIPALRRGDLPGSSRWFVARMVPGATPLDELEAALLSVAIDETLALGDVLRASDRGLHDLVLQILPDDGSELVLVIDQLEEIFTLVTGDDVRAQFLHSLLFAATQPDSRLRVIVTLRADFYDRPLMLPELGQAMRERTELVLPLTPQELQEAIVGPAERAGVRLEPGLVATIVGDVVDQPGALPLLQFALTELFDLREGRVLTLETYERSGGVLEALARRAEELYAMMEAGRQAVARQMFLRMVNLDEGSNTRRRVRWAELAAITEVSRADLQAVLDAFGKFRLLTFDHDPQTREPTVEIAHEALIRQWARLDAWLAENREALLVQRRLAAATADWVESDRNASYLATGARLAQFEALRDSPAMALTNDEIAYITASMALRRKNQRRRRLAIAALVTLTIAALVLAAFAFDRQRRAQEAREDAESAESIALAERDRADLQARISRSRELAVTALTYLDQIDLSLLLSLHALQSADTFEARSSLLSGLQRSNYISAFLTGHTDEVRSVAINPDGSLFASGSRDGAIIRWDAATLRPVEPAMVIEGARANSLAFSPDGRILAAGASDGRIYRWDGATGEPLGDPVAAHDAEIWSIAFSPDGARLATGSADNTIRLWDAASWEPAGDPLQGHADFVYSVAFSPDGARLASGGADNTIRLWDAATGAAVGDPWEGHSDWVWCIAYSPDGTLLASGSADNTIRLWDAATGAAVGEPFAGHSGWVRSAAFSPDGTLLVTGSADNTVRIWDVTNRRPFAPALTAHTDTIWSVAFGADGHTIISGSEDMQIIVWDTRRPSHLERIIGNHEDPVLDVAINPDGTLIASGSGSPSGGGSDNTVRVWDLGTGTEKAALRGHRDSVSAVAFGPDGALIASASFDGTAIVWDVESGEIVQGPLRGHTQPILSVAFSPDGTRLAAGGNDGRLIVWDVATGERVGETHSAGEENSIAGLAYSPDGLVLAGGAWDGTVALWDASTLELLGEPLAGHTGPVTSLAFSSSGRRLASGSRDNTIVIWNTATWQPLRAPFTGHSNWVLGLAFSPEGRWLVSSSRDTTLRLWDTNTGQPVGQPFAAHSDWVTGVAFSPDGRMVTSGSWDGTVRTWTVALDMWRERACAIANRELDPVEVERYFGDVAYAAACSE